MTMATAFRLRPLLAFAFALLQKTALAETDFSTTSGIVTWDQADWSLTANTYIPGQYQARVSLANGLVFSWNPLLCMWTYVDDRRYVGASLAAAGPFFEKDVNQTDAQGVKPSNGWPLFDDRISFTTIAGRCTRSGRSSIRQ